MTPHARSLNRLEDAQFLFSVGNSPEEVADRLGITMNGLRRLFARHNQKLPWVWDRDCRAWTPTPTTRRRQPS